MDARSTTLARTCLEAAETGAMTFPQIIAALSEDGFESYVIDYRRATATYYRPDGDSRTVRDLERDSMVALAFQGSGGLLGVVGKPGMFVAIEGKGELIRCHARVLPGELTQRVVDAQGRLDVPLC